MVGRGTEPADRTIAFGPFRLRPRQHQLFEADNAIRVGSRALDILLALLERPGDLVTKEELIGKVWPNTIVEEGALRVHIAALRRTLGDGQGNNRYIVNVPGRGYRFVAPVSDADAQPPPERPATAPAAVHDLPALLSRMVGRTEVVDALVARSPQQRLITIAGPGGIGKTTVAIAAAEALRESYADGVRLVDLTPLTDPGLVPSVLASALGIAIRSEDPIPSLVTFLTGKRMLIVLDNCEHVVGAVAAMATAVMNGTSAVHFLATSREPLRVPGERIHRLAPLEAPPVSAGLTAAEALTFPAIQLFVERAAANLDTLQLTDADAPIVADICRRLDGVALAIELAASRADVFGIRGVASRLDDQFNLLARGRRTALPRHQTLSATLDWSYQLLSEFERVVLRRLAILAGSFTLASASAVAAGDGVGASEVADHVANLVAKSLVSADITGETVYYRLLDTTRAHARGKLVESGEFDQIARRHAEYFCNFFMQAEAQLATLTPAEWSDVHGRQLDNARTALDWAFSPGADAALGVRLTVAVAPLWSHLSLNEECRSRVDAALARFGPEASRDSRHGMQLFAALGNALLYTKGSGAAASKAWTSTLEIAEKINDTDYQLRALRGLWADAHNASDHRSALTFAEKFSRVAATSANAGDVLVGDRMLGMTFFFRGDLKAARIHIERAVSGFATTANRLHVIRFQFDQGMIARTNLAGVLWLQGFPDQAMRMAESSMEQAKTIDHALSLTYALAHSASRIALLTGELEAAARYITMLLHRAARDPHGPWDLLGRCCQGVLLSRQGDGIAGAQLLAEVLEKVPKNSFHMRYTSFLGALADTWARVGETTKGAAAIDQALDISDRHDERWGFAELLRIKGKILLRAGATDGAAAAENHFLQSLDWSRRQGALSWELRTATSLARLRRDQGRHEEARALLTPIYRRFTEGFGTADLRAAKTLIDQLT